MHLTFNFAHNNSVSLMLEFAFNEYFIQKSIPEWKISFVLCNESNATELSNIISILVFGLCCIVLRYDSVWFNFSSNMNTNFFLNEVWLKYLLYHFKLGTVNYYFRYSHIFQYVFDSNFSKLVSIISNSYFDRYHWNV